MQSPPPDVQQCERSLSPLPTPAELEKESFPVRKSPPVIRHLRPPEGTPPRSPINSYMPSQVRKKKPEVAPFYFPLGPPTSPTLVSKRRHQLDAYFKNGPLARDQFRDVVSSFLDQGTYCTDSIWLKCGLAKTDTMNKETFLNYYEQNLENIADPKIILFVILSNHEKGKIFRSDLEPMMLDLVDRHPGLQFLEQSPSFHRKYMETVIERIFYSVGNEFEDGLTISMIRRSNFYDCLKLLDNEHDINEIFDYFSYEHFYVIYCKFWELDHDHDFVINAQDLLPYAENSLTEITCQRVADGYGEPCNGPRKGTMTYQDFIRFIISEEDKQHPRSIRYWFRILDSDGDGVLSFYEIKKFWEQQSKKIEKISPDAFHFENVQAQLKDMILPKLESGFTLAEIQRSGLASIFYNMIFNLNKFAIHEQRDPYRIEQIRANPQMTDWDRFAQIEYIRYAEEDGETASL